MIVPQFIRFYGYSLEEALNEYARAFFAMCNTMLQIRAIETLDATTAHSIPNMSVNDARNALSELGKRAAGLSKIVEEVKVVKNVKH